MFTASEYLQAVIVSLSHLPAKTHIFGSFNLSLELSHSLHPGRLISEPCFSPIPFFSSALPRGAKPGPNFSLRCLSSSRPLLSPSPTSQGTGSEEPLPPPSPAAGDAAAVDIPSCHSFVFLPRGEAKLHSLFVGLLVSKLVAGEAPQGVCI